MNVDLVVQLPGYLFWMLSASLALQIVHMSMRVVTYVRNRL